jgi:DNA modification methylase
VTRVSGLAYPTNVLNIHKNTERLDHGAVFPVALPEFFIRAYSDRNDIIFDPFSGSGTVLIASQRNDRVARAIEISPAYCDVIVQRWTSLTGGTAVRNGNPA